jgi:hypothetical protein
MRSVIIVIKSDYPKEYSEGVSRAKEEGRFQGYEFIILPTKGEPESVNILKKGKHSYTIKQELKKLKEKK